MVVLVGCAPSSSQTLKQVRDEVVNLDPQRQAEYLRKKSSADRVGDVVSLEGADPVKVEWYSLVVGLQGTGTSEIPEPPAGILGPDTSLKNELLKSLYRSNVPGSPMGILQSMDTAPVIVAAVIPPLVQLNDRLDVAVQALGGTKSLEGGVLMSTPLRQVLQTRAGGGAYGDVWAYADGKLSLSSGRLAFGNAPPEEPTRGYVPAGGGSTGTGFLQLHLRRPDGYTASLLLLAIDERFPGCPALLTTQTLRITVPNYYQSEWQRLAQVLLEVRCRPPRGRFLSSYIRRLVHNLSGSDRALAEQASYRLEALGPESVPALEGTLHNPQQSAQLLAACTLAAMREPAGITALMQTIELGSDADRRVAARYLNFYSQHNVRDFQKKLLVDRDPEVRYRALLGLEQTQEDTAYSTREEAKGDDFSISRVQCAGTPALLIKGRAPRRLIFFGPDLSFRPPFKQEQTKQLQVGAKDTSGVTVDYLVYGQLQQLPVNSMQVIELVRALDHINLPVTDIMDLIFKLSRADRISGEVVFLDE
jgi:flagellar basal body P-ring protein FlgI